MTVDGKTTEPGGLMTVWNWIASSKIVRAILWARWIITVGLFLTTLLWYAYLEGQGISENLSKDYQAVQTAQANLINDSLSLQEDLLNPNVVIDLDFELDGLRSKAKAAMGALAGLRAPTGKIEVAQENYRAALEQLLSVTSRIERGEIENMALPLHNGLQGVANAGGTLNEVIRDFQGGMWPQLIGSVF